MEELTPEIIRRALSVNGKRAAAARPVTVKTCARPGCGVQFEGTKRALYHSDACRVAVFYAANSDKLNQQRVARRKRRRDGASPGDAPSAGPDTASDEPG